MIFLEGALLVYTITLVIGLLVFGGAAIIAYWVDKQPKVARRLLRFTGLTLIWPLLPILLIPVAIGTVVRIIQGKPPEKFSWFFWLPKRKPKPLAKDPATGPVGTKVRRSQVIRRDPWQV